MTVVELEFLVQDLKMRLEKKTIECNILQEEVSSLKSRVEELQVACDPRARMERAVAASVKAREERKARGEPAMRDYMDERYGDTVRALFKDGYTLGQISEKVSLNIKTVKRLAKKGNDEYKEIAVAHQHKKQVTDTDVELMKALYNSGMTIKAVSEKVGLSYATVRDYLTEDIANRKTERRKAEQEKAAKREDKKKNIANI